ncbi:MAG: S8 family serine peptidase [Christensenellaceae bacterium]|nr:S8 family serine peptidase [Christensenellaceae bacterium]
MKKTQRLFSWLLAFAMLLGCFGSIIAADFPTASNKVTTGNVETTPGVMDPDQDVRILVRLEEKTALSKGQSLADAVKASGTLRAAQQKAQKNIENTLGCKINVENSFTLLYNGFSFEGKMWMLEKINEIPGLSATIPMEFQLLGSSDENYTTPSMGNSTVTTGATEAWELGYDGEGAVIAIIDTGIRSTHEAFSVMPENGRIDVEYLEEVIAQYGSVMHSGLDANQLYENAKIPFTWDYYDRDYDPNHTSSDHGTHVAGIAAGNNGADFKGVAPNAQLVVMQVFNENGGGPWDLLMAALEDCVYLGVDAINMSLGSTAGYSSAYSTVDGFAEVYEALENAGISVAVAAGNEGNTLTWTNYGDFFVNKYQGLASNPDIGLIGSPASFLESFAVASVVNGATDSGYMVVDGVEYLYSSVSGVDAIGSLGTAEGTALEIAYGGIGNPEELTNVEGKIALIQRGTLTFTDKCTNAAEAGAIGVILYNNAVGAFNPSVASDIPLGLLSLAEGEALKAAMENGVAECTVYSTLNYRSIQMAKTSSWGTTADLLIKPEISAPGDGIFSAIGFGGDASYDTWSGTSMATPHIAAALGVIKQHVRELFPDATETEINDLTYSFAMSTAHQVGGFVRQQGAGIVDVVNAVSSDVYLSVESNSRPKLELGESEDGIFTFTFTINNMGEEAHTYTVVPSVLTELVFEEVYSGLYCIPNTPETVKLINGTVYDVTALADITAPETVTVEANGTAEVTITIDASGEIKDYIEENCASGMYLEGFIKLVEEAEEDGIDLSIPFLGFVGDWDYPSMLDRGYYWMPATGENNPQQFYTSLYNYVGYANHQGLGINKYADMTGEDYLTDRNAISPNGDGLYDALTYIEFTMMRNAKLVKLYVEDADGNVITTLHEAEYTFRKDYYTGSMNGGDSFHFISFNYDGSELEENEQVFLVLETILDHEGYEAENNESGRWVIPVRKDTQAPQISVVDGGINIIDENYIAYYAIHSDEERTELLFETGVFADERNVAEFYETDRDVIYVTVADYAGNEACYKVEGGNVYATDIEAFDYGRTIVAQRSKNYDSGYYEFGWASFKSELPSTLTMLTEDGWPDIYYTDGIDIDIISTVVSDDGTLYGNTLREIYIIDPETFERELVLDLRTLAGNGSLAIRNLAIDPASGKLFGCLNAYNVSGLPGGWGVYRIDLEEQTLDHVCKFFSDYGYTDPWASAFIDDGMLAVYGGGLTVFVIDIETGEIDHEYDLHVRLPWDYGGDYIGLFGWGGSMLYDDTNNCIYISSDWTWFGTNYYNRAGIVKYDIDTDTSTFMVPGNGNGSVFTGMYFEDSIVPKEPVEIEGFTLSPENVGVYLGQSETIKFNPDPVDANQFDLVWTSSNEDIATVTGSNRKATVVGTGLGTATITCTVMVDGEEFGSASVDVTVTADPDLMEALNVEGGHIVFWTEAGFPFVPVEDGDRYYAQSTNAFFGDSSSVLHATITMEADDTLSFDYFVSSEADYDFFYFNVNGETELQESGELGWQSYTFTATEAGTYEFEWRFDKDVAVDGILDVVRIDNVEFSGTLEVPGDINGNGVVEVADALLVMRHVLGLIELDDATLALADVDGDGTVRMVDALLILRMALGFQD